MKVYNPRVLVSHQHLDVPQIIVQYPLLLACVFEVCPESSDDFSSKLYSQVVKFLFPILATSSFCGDGSDSSLVRVDLEVCQPY